MQGGTMRAECMTWEEYGAETHKRIVILPVGSLEQHGPHLPLNVDVVISGTLAEMVAARVGGMVLPAIAYGYRPVATSGCGQRFPGTTSLEGSTLTHLTLDILRETYRHGGRRFLILNGHWENVAFLVDAADHLIRGSPDARAMVVSWWDMISPSLIDRLFSEAGFEGLEKEHAALLETSLMLHFAPELVRIDRIIDDAAERPVPYAILPQPADVFPRSGVCYKATYASREKGEEIAIEVSEAVASAVRKDLPS
jgi:creatinine amidohydrolase